MKELIILSGVPGSGKSTDVKNMIKKGYPATIVSRDEIRFELLAEDDEYFSKEREVWLSYINQIRQKLSSGRSVIADATHLSAGSRRKLINALGKDILKDVSIAVWFYEKPLETCLLQNELRKGRAYVPPKVIEKMYADLEYPDLETEEYIDSIIRIR